MFGGQKEAVQQEHVPESIHMCEVLPVDYAVLDAM